MRYAARSNWRFVAIFAGVALVLSMFGGLAVAENENNSDTVVDLLAGQDMKVGTVTVTDDGEYLFVTYSITEGEWLLTQTHLAVGTALDDIPTNRGSNPVPGQFAYSDAHDPPVAEFTYEIPLGDINADPGDELYIAAHADVTIPATGQSEGAWGAGDRFVERGNWATYFTYTVSEPGLSPDDLDNLQLWLDAGTIEPVNDNKVSEWQDQSGNDRDATQTDGELQPQFVPDVAGLNGQAAVQFDGNTRLIHPSILQSGYTAFYVLQLTESQDKGAYYYHGGNVQSGGLGFYAECDACSPDQGWGQFRSSPNVFRTSAAFPTDDDFRIHTHAPANLYMNGAEVEYESTDTVAGGNLTAIGVRDEIDVHNQNFVGNIAEIIVYDRVLTDEEREEVEAYLLSKYGIE